jgi:hypothetical protein
MPNYARVKIASKLLGSKKNEPNLLTVPFFGWEKNEGFNPDGIFLMINLISFIRYRVSFASDEAGTLKTVHE